MLVFIHITKELAQSMPSENNNPEKTKKEKLL